MRRLLTTALLLTLALGWAQAQNWSAPQDVQRREGTVLSYRAALVGTTLLVEVRHAPGWHSYAIDNIERARRASGDEHPEVEAPTRIELCGGLETAGVWLQTPPKDLSDPDIFWYTWGFEGTAHFAVPVRRVSDDETVILINAQACDSQACCRIDDLLIRVPAPSCTSQPGPGPYELEPVVQRE